MLTHIHMRNVTALQSTRLLQLCSANLPIGGFSFSQGLEYAIEQGWIKDSKESQKWICFVLLQSIAKTDLPLLIRVYQAIKNQDFAQCLKWGQQALASRESKEFYLADVAMGKALMRLLAGLDTIDLSAYNTLSSIKEPSFVSAFALAAYLFKLDVASTLHGFCWAYIDNQVAAAIKLVPLGQTQGQNLLFELSETIEEACLIADKLNDEEIGASLPQLAMASAWHESQYTRLFRS